MNGVRAGTFATFAPTTRVYEPVSREGGGEPREDRIPLLWGDLVFVTAVEGDQAEISCRGHLIRLSVDELSTEQRVLSLWQIDCGQGDAALLRTPDNRWLMVDTGPPRYNSNSGHTAVDFLKWVVFVDQAWRRHRPRSDPEPFTLDALVMTHPDLDHHGAVHELVELLDGGMVRCRRVFHNGMGRFDGERVAFAGGEGFGQLGPVRGGAGPDRFVTALIDSFAAVRRYSQPDRSRQWTLTGEYADDLRSLAAVRSGRLIRLHAGMEWLSGYRPGDGDVAIRVLGPVAERWDGEPALRWLDTDSMSSMKRPSLTRNGHSVVLRLDIGNARILLTGDLNFRSQALLLRHHQPVEFRCHVAKACHHGSDDISTTFVQATSPIATIFSSGDNESHVHPRARAIGLAAAYARRTVGTGTNAYLDLEEPRSIGPLIYSTELSRSVRLYRPHSVWDRNGDRIRGPQLAVTRPSGTGRGRSAPLSDWMVADEILFGLVNVRTDGDRVVVAVRNEGRSSYHVEQFTV